jgi:hypothetical protein
VAGCCLGFPISAMACDPVDEREWTGTSLTF